MRRSITGSQPSALIKLGLVGMGLALMALVLLLAAPAQAWYSSGQSIPSQQRGSGLFPSVAVDGQGRVFAAWAYTPDLNNYAIAYVRGQLNGASNIAWERPIELSARAAGNSNPMLAIGPNGRVHLIYQSRDGVQYLENRNNGDYGSWGTTANLGSGYTPGITVGTDNQVYASWSDGRAVRYTYKTADGNFAGVRTIDNAGVLARNNKLAVSGTGNNATVHIIFEYKPSDRDPFTTGYMRDTPNGGFANTRDLSSEVGAPDGQEPSIAADGNTVVAVWRSGYSDSFDMVYTQSDNGGTSWRSGQRVQKSNSEWSFVPTVVLQDKFAHVTVETRDWDGSKFTRRTVNYRRYDRSNNTWGDWITIGPQNIASFPRLAFGAGYLVTVWTFGSPTDDFVQYNVDQIAPFATPTPPATATPSPTPSPTPNPAPAGALMLNNGATYTNKTTVDARIMGSNGPATKYSLNVNNQTTEGDFKPDATRSITVSVALNNPVECQKYMVTGTLTGPGGSSTPFNNSITLDQNVRANVAAVNPNLIGNSRPLGVAEAPLDIAGNYGDPAYTRTGLFLLNIDPQTNECSGLRDFVVANPGETTMSATDSRWRVLRSGASAFASLPSNQAEGAYSFKTFVRDNAGNIAPSDSTITYDATAPRAIAGATDVVSTTATTPVNDIARLDLGRLVVTDNLYPGGYWGVWVMVNTNPRATPTDADWNTYGVVNQGKLGATFDWNLAFGHDPKAQPNQTYYVHLRFIDGAGNVSGGVDRAGNTFGVINSQGIRPTAFTSFRSMFLPSITR